MKIKISLPTLTTVVFSALKVAGVIAWSWLWVLSPLWIPLAISIIITLAFLIAYKGDMEKMDELAEKLNNLREK